MRRFCGMRTSSWLVMPSWRGQNGITCIRPTAPARRDRPAVEAALDVDDRHDEPRRQLQPARFAMHVVQDLLALARVLDQRLQLRLHRREPDLLVELVLETGTGGERLLEELAELRILLAVRAARARYAERSSRASERSAAVTDGV